MSEESSSPSLSIDTNQDQMQSMSPLILPKAALPCLVEEPETPNRPSFNLTSSSSPSKRDSSGPAVRKTRFKNDDTIRPKKIVPKLSGSVGRSSVAKRARNSVAVKASTSEESDRAISPKNFRTQKHDTSADLSQSMNYLPTLVTVATDILDKEYPSETKSSAAASASSPASAPTKRRRRSNQSQCSEQERESRRKARKLAHSDIERRRRIKMNEQFESLKILVPACSHTASLEGGDAALHKLVILQETVAYVRELKEELQKSKLVQPGLQSPCLPSLTYELSNHQCSQITSSTPQNQIRDLMHTKITSGFSPRILPPPSPAATPNSTMNSSERLKISSLLC